MVFSTHHEEVQGSTLADETISLFAGRSVSAPLGNLFRGTLRNGMFDTGKLAIWVSGAVVQASCLAMDPE